MDLSRWHYRLAYRLHLSPWDTGIPTPEAVDAVGGGQLIPPGRALNLGCGTGTNSVDIGCSHTLPGDRRDAYAAGVTKAAEPGATLVMAGMSSGRCRSHGITAEQLRERFPGGSLVHAAELTSADLLARGWPWPVRTIMTQGPRRGWRFQLRRDLADGRLTS